MSDWRKIPGFPDYSVSSDGDIRSDKGRWGKAKLLSKFAMQGRAPYSYVNLYRDKKMATRRVAVIVCEAFHGPRPSPSHEAAHNNGQHSDDRLSNLRWATKLENAADRKLHGTQIRGQAINLAKLTDDAVRIIRNTPRSYGYAVRLAERFNVSTSAIHKASARKTWRHVSMTVQTKIEAQSLIGALAKALPELEGAKKNKANPAFKSRYADLGAVIEAIEPIKEHGLWYRQHSHESADGVKVETFYIHVNGEELSAGSLFMPAAKKDAQGFGSALSYCRRYALQLAFGLATEDDDGNAASKAAAAGSARGQNGGHAASPAEPADLITASDLTLAITLCDALGGNQAQTICEAYRVSSLTELTAKQGAAVVTRLNEKLEAKKETANV